MRNIVMLLCVMLANCGGAPSPEPPSPVASRTALHGADAGQDGASLGVDLTCWDRTEENEAGLIQVPCYGP